MKLQSISCFTRATPCFIYAWGTSFFSCRGNKRKKKLRKRLIFQLDVQRVAPLLGMNANAFCLFVCLQPWECRLLHIIWWLLLPVCLTPGKTTAAAERRSGCGWRGEGMRRGGQEIAPVIPAFIVWETVSDTYWSVTIWLRQKRRTFFEKAKTKFPGGGGCCAPPHNTSEQLQRLKAANGTAFE